MWERREGFEGLGVNHFEGLEANHADAQGSPDNCSDPDKCSDSVGGCARQDVDMEGAGPAGADPARTSPASAGPPVASPTGAGPPTASPIGASPPDAGEARIGSANAGPPVATPTGASPPGIRAAGAASADGLTSSDPGPDGTNAYQLGLRRSPGSTFPKLSISSVPPNAPPIDPPADESRPDAPPGAKTDVRALGSGVLADLSDHDLIEVIKARERRCSRESAEVIDALMEFARRRPADPPQCCPGRRTWRSMSSPMTKSPAH
jgi:hypothetical protein